MKYIARHPDPKKRMPLSKLKVIVENVKAKLSRDEKPTPMVINHTKEANPYKSKFGKGEWEQRLTESSGIHRYRSVMDLAEYMVAEGYRLFPDGNFWFYHDALSQIQQKGYLKHWIFPEMGLNKKTIYAKRPPGNSPKMMPWDCSLNNDLVEAVMRHVSICSFASRDEVKKFKLTSPKDVTEAYQNLMAWGGEEDRMRRELYVPGPEQIKGDITKVFSSMQEIVMAGGSLVKNSAINFKTEEDPRRLGQIGEGTISRDLDRNSSANQNPCIQMRH
jgi:hypothetical protein